MKLKSQYQRLTQVTRLYQLTVPVIALTGGIATGKTTVAKILAQKGLPIINADQLVKEIYTTSEAQTFIQQHHPDVLQNGAINFLKLREKVFNHPSVKDQIEQFIYSRLPKAFELAYAKLGPIDCVIYDIPLLFEKNMQHLFDVNLLVYAPRSVQLSRLVSRDGHNEDLANKILDQQMDIEEKKKRADMVIDNSRSETELAEEIETLFRQIFI